MKNTLTLLSIVLLFTACDQVSNTYDHSGNWRAYLETPGGELPFIMEIEDATSSGGYATITIRNAEERIFIDTIHSFSKDSMQFNFPVFDSEISASISDSSMSGFFYDHSRKDDYKIPFHATKGDTVRFRGKKYVNQPLVGKWEAVFIKDTDTTFAVMELKDLDGALIGTFMTPTGDYRYLEGSYIDGTLKLSAFDGSHAFLFTADVKGRPSFMDNGKFYSGNHWEEDWFAVMNPGAVTPDPYSLTEVTVPVEKLELSYTSDQGQLVSLDNPQFKDNVTVIQIMGSWCPNCMDESQYLAELYDKRKDDGLEILAVAYERTEESEVAYRRINKMKHDLGLKYPVVFGGSASKTVASDQWPMLNEIISYPTTLVLNKQHEIVKVHTGFNGPATGELYQEFVRDFTGLVDSLLQDPGAGTVY